MEEPIKSNSIIIKNPFLDPKDSNFGRIFIEFDRSISLGYCQNMNLRLEDLINELKRRTNQPQNCDCFVQIKDGDNIENLPMTQYNLNLDIFDQSNSLSNFLIHFTLLGA